MNFRIETLVKLALIPLIASLSACGIPSEYLNPFHPDTPPEAFLGEPNDNALYNGGASGERARAALEKITQSQPAHSPKPYNPVMKPSIVRLMWVPDHLNRHGDLVPAHYYYLKVKGEQWAVSDAFELEQQLQTGGAGSNFPFVFGR